MSQEIYLGSSEELLGTIESQPTRAAKIAAVKKITTDNAINSALMTSRDWAKRQFNYISDANVKKAIQSGELQFMDASFFVVKATGGLKTIKMLENPDTISPIAGSIAGGKLEKDNWTIITGFIVLEGVHADGASKVDFTTVTANTKNGWHEFKVNSRFITGRYNSNEMFDHDRTDLQKGLYLLDNPKWIPPMQPIEFDMEFAAAAAANTFHKVIFIGTKVAR